MDFGTIWGYAAKRVKRVSTTDDADKRIDFWVIAEFEKALN